MSSKRILGIAGAAMIGTLAGTGAVHAVIGIGSSGATTSAATFAKETLRKSGSGSTVTPLGGGSTTYYQVAAHAGNSGEIDVNIPIGISVPGSPATTALIQVDLENLVLGRAFDAAHASITNTETPAVAITGATFTREEGGALGDNRVWLNLTTDGTNEVPANSRLVLQFDFLGVDADNDGTITVTARRTATAGVTVLETTTLTDAVKVMSVFEVEATPITQTASVEDGFMKFREDDTTVESEGRLKASIGKLDFGVATSTSPIYNAGRAGAPRATLTSETGGQIISPRQVVESAVLVLTGNTSFLGEDGKVFISRVADCSSESVAFMADENDGNKLKATLSAAEDTAGGGHFGTSEKTASLYVCLEVDGETTIPQVDDPYEVAATFTGVNGAESAFPPGAFSGTLGGIERDGSNVDIAYLTTNQKYNQRLVLVNRSGGMVEYSIGMFRTSEGTTAEAGNAASGTLQPRSRTVLDVRDIVTFDNGGNGGHGSAQLTAVVASGMLDVATVTTTRSDGSTDTVVWDSQ